MKNVLGALTRFVAQITRNPIGMAGAVLTTISAVLFFTLFALELAGFHGGPYLGILAFAGGDPRAVRVGPAADPARTVA